ncbi:hypothetical protein EJ02DRAFT_492277 [Clathrospora elynae]|uniref:Uncharacterized protein n=1 Tax=Clathrospora elynae TaxID=706981 RepID=A0A6A5S1E2_9PLEO|nr:hypothetical protein EJ02DRAFT_492277 [Clathrospora elynae]
MLAIHRRFPELSPQVLEQNDNMAYCYQGMQEMFVVNGIVSPPHLVTGNKMRLARAADLLDFLFLWDNKVERPGWGSKPYRLILQKSFELVEIRLGYRRASQWLDEFFYLVCLTH